MGAGDGYVVITIMANALEASIRVCPPTAEEGLIPDYEMARSVMKEQGVVFGIDDGLVRTIFQDRSFDQEIIFAKGIPPEHGIDGKIEYFFETEKDAKPEEDEKGNVDYKNINLLTNVRAGDRLAEVIPPIPGVSGKDVKGGEMLPRIGALIPMPKGPGTEVSKENENILVASTEGNVHLNGSYVQVDDFFQVDKDVDFSTGNINYLGSAVIKGSIRAGFEVKVGGALEVNGLIEDAKVEAEGDIIVKNGFLGKNNGLISTKGNVMIKFIQNQNMKAEGDITVGEIILHSKVISNSNIDVTGRKGAIVGGYVSALKSITVKELGNYQEVDTEIVVGVNEELAEKLKLNILELEKYEDNSEKIAQAVKTLNRKRKITGSLPPEQTVLLKKFETIYKALPIQKKQLDEDREAILKEMEAFTGGCKVDVQSKINKGVTIRIGEKRKIFDREENGGVFKIIDAQVQKE